MSLFPPPIYRLFPPPICLSFHLQEISLTTSRSVTLSTSKMSLLLPPRRLSVYSKNRSNHFGHIKIILMQCREFGISLNPSKSIFGVTKGNLSGHFVSDSIISIDPEKIVAIVNLPAPTSKKEVQDFMRVINFVDRFVPYFVVMVKPIHNLLKKDRSFSWTDDVQNAFVGIKKEINFAPVLVKPYFEKEFMIYTNATEEVVCAILMQCDDQVNEKPVD
jgi:hypothetical protein